MGSIYRRGKRWWVSYYRGGKQYFESSRSERKQDAKTLLQLREGDIAKGIPVTPKNYRVTWDDAAQDVLNDYTANGKKSYDHVARRLEKHLTPWFGGRRLSTISTADIRAYIAHRQAETVTNEAGEAVPCPAANATINRELAIIKRAFTLAMQAGKVMSRPHVPMLAERNVRQGFFERDQFEAVRRRLPEDLQGVVTFAYLTGWRKSEILTLQWRQVDLKAGYVRLEPGTTKNGEGRTFYCTDELRSLLEARKAASVVDGHRIVPWVFHRHGEPICSFQKAWQTACEGAGVPGRIFHDFRRTAVRNLVRAGVPERVAMQMTGHKTRSVFERYNVVSEGDLKNAAVVLQAARNDTRLG